MMKLTRMLMVSLALAVPNAAWARNPDKPVPQAQITFLPQLAENEPAATVRILRNSQMLGSAMTTTLTIDGRDAAAIRNGQSLEFRIPPGEHILGLRFLGNDPSGALTLGLIRKPRWIEAATTFEPGATYIFRIIGNSNWEWDLQRSSR